MQYCAYSFLIFKYVFTFLNGFWDGVVVQKTTLNMSTNAFFCIFLQIFESFSGSQYYTANSFVTNICGVIFTAPIHWYYYLFHNCSYSMFISNLLV